jgi:hypothetical protein
MPGGRELKWHVQKSVGVARFVQSQGRNFDSAFNSFVPRLEQLVFDSQFWNQPEFRFDTVPRWHRFRQLSNFPQHGLEETNAGLEDCLVPSGQQTFRLHDARFRSVLSQAVAFWINSAKREAFAPIFV